MRVIAFAAAVSLAVAACSGGSASDALYPTVDASLADSGTSRTADLRLEVVHLPLQRQQGLMRRTELDDSAGMLFLFPNDHSGGFWMKDTYLALDIAYVDSNWRVVDIKAGTPLDTSVLTPSEAYRYVIEVNQGWFAEHGLGIGTAVSVPVGELPTPE